MTTALALSAVATECALCGLALPTRPVAGDGDRAYCCHGCAHVDAILRTVGAESDAGRLALDAARQRGLLSVPDAPPVEEIDLPAAVREEARLRVEGLACPSCAWLVESVLRSVPGVASARVDYLSDTARIVFDIRSVEVETLARAASQAGYGLSSLESGVSGDERRDQIRLSVAAAVAMNLMALAFVGYDSFFTGLSESTGAMLAAVQLLIAIPVVTWCALPIYRRALAALRCGRVVMETLLSLGILAAAGLSTGAVVAGLEHLYLETATVLVTLALGGRALERWFKRRAVRSLTGLLQFSPSKARREDGHFDALTAFREGDRLIVECDEDVPLDVRSLSNVTVREGLLTGEPRPMKRRAGELILAGSRVTEGHLVGSVERPAGQTVADKMRSRVEHALTHAEEGSRLADRLAQGFVPLVVLVAAASLVGHLLSGAGAVQSTLIAVSVLVIACPCSFGVAASLCLSLSVMRLAREGVLVKDPRLLEALPGVTHSIFDKTGTLTRGDLTLLNSDCADRAMLAGVRALERHSRHPVGLALARDLGAMLAPLNGSTELAADDIVEIPARGVTGLVNGQRLAVGTRELFDGSKDRGSVLDHQSSTRVWFGRAGENPSGHLDLADALRPEAKATVRALGERRIASELLSGDAQETTSAIAEEAGITSAHGALRPEEKAEHVRKLQGEGQRVMFVGDGFNDAEALAAADVGVAMASGADLALHSAPVVITRSDLRALVALVDISRRSVRVLQGNMAWAFFYNVAFIPVAAFGFLAPVHAAALMTLSSLSVALNSLRVRSTTGSLVEG
jgi:heavy metal translocating P-type ATPase